MHIPRIVIAGLSGGSGKTLVSLGLARAFVRQGLDVQPFKKGPDYIDAAWLEKAARRSCANLDPWFSDSDFLRAHLAHCCLDWGPSVRPLALIEGNRGLFDGKDAHGVCSTANLALSLQAPVILVINCLKMTRTVAAIVAGLDSFEPGLRLGGVILNNVGTQRQARLLREAVSTYTLVPVLGCLPRLQENPLPERHMGLQLDAKANNYEQILDNLADYLEANADLQAIWQLACASPDLPEAMPMAPPDKVRARIGYVKDDAFWFYYRENLEALKQAGAELVQLSLLDAKPWPQIDGLYLGGGFPELYSEQLSQSPQMAVIRAMVEQERPVYAECGGILALCRNMIVEGKAYPMAGILDADVRFFARPQGLGYVQAKAVLDNPWHPKDLLWVGHEFHYTSLDFAQKPVCVLKLEPGVGLGQGRDGLCRARLWASYTHLYAPAVPHWARRFVDLAVN